MVKIPTVHITLDCSAAARTVGGTRTIGAPNLHLWHVQSGLQKLQIYFPNFRKRIENYRNCSCTQQERTMFKINFALATG